MNFRMLFSLILCNLIWSATPAMGKLVLREVSPVTVAWLRFSSAFFAFLVGLILLRARPSEGFMRLNRLVATLGILSFGIGPFLQLTGLQSSRAIDNSLIIAMEPMLTVMLAWLLLRERPTRIQFASFGIALTGFALLSGLTLQKLTGTWDGGAHLLGNLILLVSLTGEAAYSPLGRMLMAKNTPLKVFGTTLAIGVAFLSLGSLLLGQFPSFLELSQLSWEAIFGVFWLGPLGTTATYLYWMFALTRAPIASIVLTIFVQPVFGTLWGHLFLSERLSAIQALGAALILVAVFTESGRQITRGARAKN
jgi:drug/metabolite transporter (DMT)-like permease